MKILFIASGYSIHSLKWVEYFSLKGHDVYWASLEQFAYPKKENIHYYLLRGLRHFKKIVKEAKPDIVHAHYAGRNGFIASFSGFHPLVITAWGSDVLITAQKGIKGMLVRSSLKKADLITCDAEHLKEAMIKLGVIPDKIKIICFGIDIDKFFPGEKDEALLNKLGIKGNKTVVSLRNLEPLYDQKTLIESASKVLKEIPNVKFVIIGKGSMREELVALAEKKGVSKNILFLERVLNDEIARYLRTFDIYVSTALSDAGISASTAEAMACGLPVIATDVGENKDWVKDYENGFIVPVKDPDILAEKIIYLLKNNVSKIKENNVKLIAEKNNYKKEMDKMEQLYERITSS